MRPSLFSACLSSLLKLLTFLQSFLGLSLLVYSLFLWNRHGDGAFHLPAPWLVCLLMGIGGLLCFVSLVGHVAAESSSACCLCFYSVLAMVFVLVEAFSVVFLLMDRHWEEDLPKDSTGELRRLLNFIEANLDIFKWAGAVMISIQVLSLLLAFVLRTVVPSRSTYYDNDSDYAIIGQPLLNPQFAPAPVLTSFDGRGTHSDFWSTRMRQKYGFKQGEQSYNTVEPSAPPL